MDRGAPAPASHGGFLRPGACTNARPLPAGRTRTPKYSLGEGSVRGVRRECPDRESGVRGERSGRGAPRADGRRLGSREARLVLRSVGGEGAPGQRQGEGSEPGSESRVGLREEDAGASGLPGSGGGVFPRKVCTPRLPLSRGRPPAGLTSAPAVRAPRPSDGKASACNAGDLGLIPRSGRSPGEGNGNPLQYSCHSLDWCLVAKSCV